MCGVCGCNEPSQNNDKEKKIIAIEEDILAENNRYATLNRNYFSDNKILALNLVSSPGSGKTTLLENSLKQLRTQFPISVLEGDQQTDRDAQRIRATGTPVYQLNTGKGCHLDAHQIHHALSHLSPPNQSILFIENVGNLVCPALFDLGEAHKIVILSVTEGDDKPLKYPHMFHESTLMIINKMDLLPYVDFNLEQCIDYAKRINPKIQTLSLSANQPTSLTPWITWLTQQFHHQKTPQNAGN